MTTGRTVSDDARDFAAEKRWIDSLPPGPETSARALEWRADPAVRRWMAQQVEHGRDPQPLPTSAPARMPVWESGREAAASAIAAAARPGASRSQLRATTTALLAAGPVARQRAVWLALQQIRAAAKALDGPGSRPPSA